MDDKTNHPKDIQFHRSIVQEKLPYWKTFKKENNKISVNVESVVRNV